MKRMYICGDSFCVDDPEYGKTWVNLLQESTSDLKVINLASSGASNYLIYLQVKKALAENCDYLIYNATSSIRQEFSIKHDSRQDCVERYWNLNNNNRNTASMICSSWETVDRHNSHLIQKSQVKKINDFFKEFVDLPNLIEKNFVFIDYTLNLLSSSNTAWAWTRGGFEHPSFGSTRPWNFDRYQTRECNINLWDYYVRGVVRPWFHVTDPEIHQKVCNHYQSLLNLSKNK